MSATATQAETVPSEMSVSVQEAEAAPVHEEASASTPAETADKPVEPVAEKPEEPVEEKKDEKPAPHEITHGTLSKNSHGALLSFFKQKRFFYFQDDAISEDHLRLYLSKDSASKSNAAYATQTGKGLWFYTKDESRKDSPHGIIKLSDVTDVVASGPKQFFLKLPTGDLHFEAHPSDRDNWVFTLKSKVDEAKASVVSITESEAYKTALEKFNKPLSGHPHKPAEELKNSEESKAEEPVVQKAEPAGESGVASDEEAGPSDSKGTKRSPSKKGKRTSKFSDFFGGKKEKAEGKEGENKEEKVAEAAESSASATAEPVSDVHDEKKADDEAKPSDEGSSEPKSKLAAPIKRHSFFRVFEKKDKEVSEMAKDTPAETTEGDAKAAEIPSGATEEKAVPVAPSSPPKRKFLPLLGKREKSPSPKAPEDKIDVAVEAKPEAPTEVNTDTGAATEAAVETPKDNIETPTEAMSPATKEKRKSSFFSFKKEKKPEEVKSDSEDAEPASHKSSPSPVPKGLSLTSLKRKVSRAGKAKEPETKEVSSPPAVAEEEEKEIGSVAANDNAAPDTAQPIKNETEAVNATVISDVPEAASVGQTQPVQAAA